MPATKLSIYREAIRLFGDARLDVITDDAESRYTLDDAWAGTVDFCLRAAPWRFATKNVALPGLLPGDAAPGFAFVHQHPSDWLRTLSLYLLGGPNSDLERPIDAREETDKIFTNFSDDVCTRYISSDFADPELAGSPWPEHFSKAVAAHLAFSVADRLTNSAAAAVRMSELYGALMQEAVLHDAVVEDPWLRFQLDGTFQEALLYVLRQGYWRFALKETKQADLTPAVVPGPVYNIRLIKPTDWVRTHALFIPIDDNLERPFDIRERRDYWDTDAAGFVARYVSTTYGLDPLAWPEPFLVAVLAYLTPTPPAAQQGSRGAQAPEVSSFAGAVSAALAIEAEAEDPWLLFQLDGAFAEASRYVLRQGAWRFAMKTVAQADLATALFPAAGYSSSYAQPVDWLRTHALFIPIAGMGLEKPFDVREHDQQWSTDATGFAVRYVSEDLGTDPFKQPQPFLAAVLAYLTPTRSPAAAEQGGRPETSPFMGILGAALVGFAEPEDPWLRYQLDGSFLEGARYVLAQGYWRFALKTVQQTDLAVAAPIFYYSHGYLRPEDWLRTHALFIPTDDMERPFDVKEHHDQWSTDAADFAARYVSTDLGLDPLAWPEPFLVAVLAYLTPAPAPHQQGQDGQLAEPAPSSLRSALMMALTIEAEPEDPWLRYQLDGSFLEGALYVLKQGYWDFALKTIELQAAPITVPPPTIPIIGYPYSYPQPDDMLRSHAFFVPAGDGREYPIDVKEDANQWSTTANNFAVRYVSSELGLRPELWQEPFLASVLAYLQLRDIPEAPQQVSRTTGQAIPAVASFRNTLQAALAIDASPENPWYRFSRTGAFLRAVFHVAETGRWKFAIATIALEADAILTENAQVEGMLPANVYGDGSISPSYSAVFAKPADWLRTIWVYRVEPHITPNVNLEGWPDRHDIDYRDEKGNWHTNWRTIQVRYVRRAAIESWRWPQSYADAVLAWLEYEEARTDPKATAVAAAKQRIYEDAVDKAAKSDDMQEFPPYRRVGHLVRGRYSRIHGHGAQDFTRF